MEQGGQQGLHCGDARNDAGVWFPAPG
jgi:hypothetical protein